MWTILAEYSHDVHVQNGSNDKQEKTNQNFVALYYICFISLSLELANIY